MSGISDYRLRNYGSEDIDDFELLARHFNSLRLRNWHEVGDESRRVFDLMFGESVMDGHNIEAGSPIADLLTNIAAAGAESVFDAIGRSLGVSNSVVQMALHYHYYGNCDEKSRTPEQFLRMLAECEKEAEEIERGAGGA